MLNDDIQLEKKGLDIAYRYYWKIGRPVLEELFPDYMDQIAVGLVGEGSECFGYDDKISTDHDYGASFCIWLPREAYNKIGDEMNGIYDALPKEIGGVTSKIQRVESQGRRGVLEIEAFYQKFLGKNGIPKTLSEWMVIPEHYLAVATNGRVFEDNLGMFSKIRETLLAYYPEDVRLKKIAARAIMMAHSGQCNYARMMRRGDTVAAHFALDEFMSATVSMAYLLNKKYAPYYKWMWRGMENLEKLTKVRALLEEISRIRLDSTLWCTNRWDTYQYSLNTNDRIVVLIEEICALVIEEMKNQEISSSTSDYLEEHAYAARHRIRNEEIRSLPILAS